MYSIFSDWHKAAKKKSDYIWSLNKFSSDFIWGAPDSDKSDDMNTIVKDFNSECKSSGSISNPKTNKINGKLQEDRQRSNACKSSSSSSHQNTQRSFDTNVLVTEDSKIVNFEKLSPNQRPGNREQARKTLKGSSVSSVVSNEWKKISYADSFDKTEANSKVHARNHIKGDEKPNYKQKLVDSVMKVTGKLKHFWQEEQRKRARHSSGSTTSCNIASQRKSPKRTILGRFNSKFSVPKTMLSVKIVQEDHCSKFIVKNSDFYHIMTKSPKVKELFPAIDTGEKVIDFSAEAAKIVLGSARYRGKDIAVKIITKASLSIDFQTKFLPRELQMLSEMRHPNIVNIYRIYKYPNRVYIFMELIGRGDLLGFIRSRGRLSESEACQLFQQMISAVQYLHGKNIAHRDLKCENIMITDSNQVKLIDFGFCRHTRDANGRRILSRTFCGSTAYAAPEVLQGIPYNPMMYDVWSLGCVLFIMVTGTMPFNDSNVRKMVSYQMKKRYHYPGSFFLTKLVKSVISRMLEPDVTKRATINHISRSNWIQHNKKLEFSTKHEPLDRGNSRHHPKTIFNDPSGSKSIGTQTIDYNGSEEFDITQWLPNMRSFFN